MDGLEIQDWATISGRRSVEAFPGYGMVANALSRVECLSFSRYSAVMNPSDRVKYIKEIAEALSSEDWPFIDLTLRQFSQPTVEEWYGNDRRKYIFEMILGANNETLLDLARHVGVAIQFEPESDATFLDSGSPLVFLSHLASRKVFVGELKSKLASLGIDSFLAHEDIEPTKEWQAEIESALARMDGLVALLAPGFKDSNWCDQEIGFALAKRVPIVSVRLGLDPYGFIGKYQAIQGNGKNADEIANDLYEVLVANESLGPKVTSRLVMMLGESLSFKESRRLIARIEKSPHLTEGHASLLRKAVDDNRQVAEAWDVPKRILAIERSLIV